MALLPADEKIKKKCYRDLRPGVQSDYLGFNPPILEHHEGRGSPQDAPSRAGKEKRTKGSSVHALVL